ncbi:MAG: MFS transporter [Bacillota bacterium]
MRFSYGRLFVLGLGFFSISLTWALYNAFVPVFLDDVLTDSLFKGTLIGAIMTFDNIAAITLQPFFGARSDRTWNRFGRRMPYLLVGVPLSALLFAVVPFLRHSVAPLITGLVAMNIAMAVWRAPAVAMMPDLTPSPLRSKGNGIINFMGGFGALLAFFVGSRLFGIDPSLPFVAAGGLMLVIIVLLRLAIREQPILEQGTERPVGIVAAFHEVWSSPERSPWRLLLAIFFWFVGWNGVEAFFTLYARDVWGMSPDAAALRLGFFSLTFLVFAIPSGFIATRLGRRRTIQTGVAGLGIALLLMGLFGNTALLLPLLLLGGLFWALININSYPMVVDMVTAERTGAYTGLYYFFSSLAAISAPPVFGFLMDRLGRGVMFWAAFTAFAAAFLLMSTVRRGEARESQA